MAANDHLNESICIEKEMPISWRPESRPFKKSEIEAINQHNQTLLNAITVMEEQGHVDIYDHSQSSQEVLRLDAKIDLLTSLVTRLLFQNHMVPPSVPINLTFKKLSWQGDIGAQEGEVGIFDLFVHPAIAVPLQLPGKVIAEHKAAILELSSDVQNALEKYLFRQHRRAIAESKKQSKKGD